MDSIVAGTVVAILAAPLIVVLFYVGATLVVLPLTGESIFRFTDRALVDEILALVPMRPGQRFYDLGCGEGRVLIAAQRKYGVHAIGYEVNVCAYLYARLNIWWHGGGAEVRFRNFMHVDLSDADVIYCYQASGAIQQLRDKFNRDLRPGTIVISNTYTIERWLTPTVVTLAHGIITRNIYLYQVPSSHPSSPATPGPTPFGTTVPHEV
ncbi:MAG: cyclopropane-fatty-acyl-phospholipid synthase family protein [Candidatus Methylomirabilales bacterium]